MTLRFVTPISLAAASLIAACGSMPSGNMSSSNMSSSNMTSSNMTSGRGFSQAALPDPVRVPAGHSVALETVGVGEITYECRPKANMASEFEWVFVGPQADLNSRSGTKIGTYYGPPATWASSDGSKITGTQVAVAPAGTGNIPLQLVKVNPASGAGSMNSMTYIQRVATKGGVAPASACSAATAGRREIVRYQADYIFWKAS